jgi:hypothetical protein
VLNNVRGPNKRTIAAHGPALNIPPNCHHVQQPMTHHVDDAESRSMYLRRLRNKDFTRGSYVWSEGGSVSVDLPTSREVIAPIGAACRGLDGLNVVVNIELNYPMCQCQFKLFKARTWLLFSVTVTSQDLFQVFMCTGPCANAAGIRCFEARRGFPFCLWSKPPYMSGTVWDGLVLYYWNSFTSLRGRSKHLRNLFTLFRMVPLSCGTR